MRQSVVMYVLKVHSDILQCRISKAVQSQAKALPRRHDSPKLPGLPLLSAPSYRALTPTNLAKPLEGCTWYETLSLTCQMAGTYAWQAPIAGVSAS